MKKKILVMSAILALTVSSLAGCGGSSSNAVEIPKLEESVTLKSDKPVEYTSFDEDGFTLIAENDKYALYMDEAFDVINVLQKSTKEVWSTAPEGATAPKDKYLFKLNCFNETIQKTASSNLESFKMEVIATSALEDKNGNKGVRVTYSDASDFDLDISIEFYITDKGLEVKLPTGCLEERGVFKLKSIDMFPNMAKAKNSQEGYYMYPDGSGAVMEFQDASHESEDSVTYDIYGDITQYKNMLGEWEEAGNEVFMPISGVKIDDKSYLSIIEAGEETATITVDPGNGEEYNIMYNSFVFRNEFAISRENSTQETFRRDVEYLDIDRVISYNFFEAGEDITYADMAVEYRDYLMNECGVEKKSDDTAIPVSMNIFMGINEEGTITDSFKAVTTFAQAEDMVNQLMKKEVENLEVQLKGWTKNGYFTDPIQFPVNSDIGGNDGLKTFASKYEKDKVQISLETNLVEARKNAKGYDSNSEIVINGNYSPISDPESNRYILTPNVAAGNLNALLKDAKDTGAAIDGISFYSIGQYVTYNYSTQNTLNVAQCKKLWTNMLETANESYENVTVQGGNQYVLPYADKLTDVPYADAGYRMTTKSVPVYQIAVHGLVNYTGNALNLSSDKEEEKLKWVEYGYVPFFELTYSGSEELMHTEYSELFSSTFSSWVDEAADVYKDFNKNLIDVWNLFIVDHEEIQEDVFKVTYQSEDKKTTKVVYVNYNDDVDCEIDGVLVEANSYEVK